MEIATDLHGHTMFSDGRATPEAYVEHRRELKMRVIAVADHDLFAGVRRAAEATLRARAGMILVPAAEITAFLHFGTDAAEQFHVLAYFAPDVLLGGRLEQTALYRRGLRVQEAWRAFVLAWLDGLPGEDREALDGDGAFSSRGAAEFPALQATLDLVVARRRSVVEAFRKHHVRFWEDDRALFGWTPEECIETIRGDGALEVVAHPARYRDRERTRAVLAHARGLEVYTSRHKPEVAAEYRRFAEENGKLWTASADDHQNARYIRPPCGTPVATLERIFKKPLPMSMVLAGGAPQSLAPAQATSFGR